MPAPSPAKVSAPEAGRNGAREPAFTEHLGCVWPFYINPFSQAAARRCEPPTSGQFFRPTRLWNPGPGPSWF